MKQLNLAATFAASIVLTIFSLTFWSFEDRPFEPSLKAEQAAYVARQAENFGGKFGVRGPHFLRASTAGKKMPRDYEFLVPVKAVSR